MIIATRIPDPPRAPTQRGLFGLRRGRRRHTARRGGFRQTGAITETLTYTLNGEVETLTDGEGNLTTWAYDGFDRPWRMYYPNASGGGSSSTDYEQVTYDADGLLYSSRTRDNQLFYFSFNALGQLDYVTTPGSQLDIQTYSRSTPWGPPSR